MGVGRHLGRSDKGMVGSSGDDLLGSLLVLIVVGVVFGVVLMGLIV